MTWPWVGPQERVSPQTAASQAWQAEAAACEPAAAEADEFEASELMARESLDEVPYSFGEEAESDQPEEFETADFERVQADDGEATG